MKEKGKVKKVASSIKATNVTEFWEWLDDLGYHIPETRRLQIWRKARNCKMVIWIAYEKEDFCFIE